MHVNVTPTGAAHVPLPGTTVSPQKAYRTRVQSQRQAPTNHRGRKPAIQACLASATFHHIQPSFLLACAVSQPFAQRAPVAGGLAGSCLSLLHWGASRDLPTRPPAASPPSQSLNQKSQGPMACAMFDLPLGLLLGCKIMSY